MTIDPDQLAAAIVTGTFADVVAACGSDEHAVGMAMSRALSRYHADRAMRIDQSLRWLDSREAKGMPYDEFMKRSEFFLKAHHA